MSIRIATLARFLPASADSGGVIRVSRLNLGLGRLGPLTLYCRTSVEEADRLAGHDDLWPYTALRLRRLDAAAFAKVDRILTDEAMAHWMADEEELGAALEADHRADPFDVVVCHQLFAAHIASRLRGVPVVLDEHNVESVVGAQAMSTIRIRVRPDVARIAGAIAAYEDAVWSRMSRITCTTESDAEAIRRRTSTPVDVVPNGTAIDEIPFVPPSRRRGGTILFIGGYSWPPNANAARFLAREVLPRVCAEMPEARLVLCGKSPGVDVALLKRPGVEVTGTVPSVTPYLAEAAVYANALFEGGGSSLKALEALAAGIPMIATTTGVRGHPLVAGRHYVPAEDAETFADALLAVLRDPTAFDAMAAEGRALAESFGWGRIADGFADLVAEVAGGSRPDQPAPDRS